MQLNHVLPAVVASSAALAYHGTSQSQATGGGSWIPIIIILGLFGGGIWAFWTFVLESDSI